jgi:hypothetical protein
MYVHTWPHEQLFYFKIIFGAESKLNTQTKNPPIHGLRGEGDKVCICPPGIFKKNRNTKKERKQNITTTNYKYFFKKKILFYLEYSTARFLKLRVATYSEVRHQVLKNCLEYSCIHAQFCQVSR